MLCREEGSDLSKMHKEGLLGSTDLVGIVKEVAPCKGAQTDEELGLGEFQEKYFPHPLYIDEKKDAYKYLGDRSLLKDISIFRWNVFGMYRYSIFITNVMP